MTRRNAVPITVDHDRITSTCVVVCHRCDYRELVRTRAAGWTHAALHLKAVHDELHAAHVARDCARKSADAADSPDHRAHGYKADTRQRSADTGSGRGRSRRAGGRRS